MASLRDWDNENDFLARSQLVLDEHEALKAEVDELLEKE
jgi:hypothetical protein